MGILASIYTSKEFGDCSNNGISARFKAVVIVNAGGPFDPTDDAPGVEVIKHPAGPKYPPIAVPVEGGKGSRMMGGGYVGTSDSRLADLVESLGWPRMSIVPLHDRYESAEETRRMT